MTKKQTPKITCLACHMAKHWDDSIGLGMSAYGFCRLCVGHKLKVRAYLEKYYEELFDDD